MNGPSPPGRGHLPCHVAGPDTDSTHSSTVTTSAHCGNNRSMRTRCTSGSVSRQASARTVSPKVQIVRLAHGGQHHGAGGDAGEHEAVDAARPQHHVEIAARERARPPLGDLHVTRPGRDLGVDLGARGALDVEAGLCDGGESPVARPDLRETGTQRDDHVDHRDARRPGPVDGPAQARQVSGAVVGDVHDGPLDVHHEKGVAQVASRTQSFGGGAGRVPMVGSYGRRARWWGPRAGKVRRRRVRRGQ